MKLTGYVVDRSMFNIFPLHSITCTHFNKESHITELLDGITNFTFLLRFHHSRMTTEGTLIMLELQGICSKFHQELFITIFLKFLIMSNK
jgi:hypothetical protein